MAERTVPARNVATEREDRPELIRRPDPLAVTTPAEFANAFATLREQAGISIRDLARTVGATSSTVGGYFSGRHLPPISATPTVEKILAACGVPAGAPCQAWIDALNRVRRLPGPRPADEPVPYRGLESYGPDDASYFFGRERLVARLVALVTSAASAGPTVLVGPSGSGKSSALHAGLAARLRASGNWEVCSLTPGARPLEALDHALDEIREMKLPPGSRVAVIVDQFEELYTLGASPAERQAFVSRLTVPLHPGPGIGPAVTVVIALRADFYGAALRHESLALALQDRQVVVGPMTEVDLRRAISEPARAAGVQLDPGLAELVLHDMAPAPATPPAPATSGAANGALNGTANGTRSAQDTVDDARPAHDAGALPLMSFALLETWRRGRRNRLTVEDYVAAGGISGAVATAAEAVHADLTSDQRELTRRLFLRLVALSDVSADTRRRATAAELGLDVPEGDDMSEVLERFVAARLLTTTETTVEIAHEAVFVAWPRLRGWLDADRAGLVTHRRLADASLMWERDGRDPSVLHRGAALIGAREWAADPAHVRELSAPEAAFLTASIAANDRDQAAARRRARRVQSLLAAVSVLALLTAGLSAVALVQRSSAARDRDRALSRQLAEAANRLRRTDPSAAGQFAVLAWRTARTTEARSALLDATATPIARRVDGTGGPAAVAVSGDGRVMAAVGDQGGLRIWTLGNQPDPVTTEVSTIPAADADADALYAVALDRTGKVVVAAGASGVLHAWDLSTPNRPAPLPSAPLTRTAILGLAFSADGHTLAVAVGDGRVLLYDVRPGSGAATLTALGVPLAGPAKGMAVQAVAFSSDGKALAAAGVGGRVALWTLADRARPQAVSVQLAGPTGAVTSLAFSPDGHRLVAGSKDQKAYVWQLATPTVPPMHLDDAGSWVNAVAFSPDNAYVVAGGSDHHLRLYETASRAIVADLPHPGPVTAATYLSNGRTLVTGSADGSVRLWPTPGPTAAMTSPRTISLAYLGKGRLAAMTSTNSLRLFDVTADHRPRPIGRPASAPGTGTPGLAGTMATDRTGTIVAAGGTDGTVWLFRVPEASPSAGAGTISLLATLPKTHKDLVESAAISPDGTTLVTGSDDGMLQFTDIATPTAPKSLGAPIPGGGVPYALAYSPDGRTLAAGTGNPNTVTLWNVRDRAHPQRIGEPLTGPTLQVHSVAFSPDGHTLVVGSADRSVRLLDVEDPASPRWLGEPLLGAGDYVNGVGFAPDGRTIAAASGDGVVRLWDVKDREEPVSLAALSAAGDRTLYAVAFDREHGRLAAAGVAQTVWQWDLDADAAAKRVCSLAGAPIPRQEWTRYLPSVPYSTPCKG